MNCAFPNLEELTEAIICELKSQDDPCLDPNCIYNGPPCDHKGTYLWFQHIATNPTNDPKQNQDTVRMYLHQNMKCKGTLAELQCQLSSILIMFKKRNFKFLKKIDNVKHIGTQHTLDECDDNVLITDLYIFYS